MPMDSATRTGLMAAAILLLLTVITTACSAQSSDEQRLLDAAKKGEYTALLGVPSEVTKEMTVFTTDPAPMERHRNLLARAIVALHTGP